MKNEALDRDRAPSSDYPTLVPRMATCSMWMWQPACRTPPGWCKVWCVCVCVCVCGDLKAFLLSRYLRKGVYVLEYLKSTFLRYRTVAVLRQIKVEYCTICSRWSDKWSTCTYMPHAHILTGSAGFGRIGAKAWTLMIQLVGSIQPCRYDMVIYM